MSHQGAIAFATASIIPPSAQASDSNLPSIDILGADGVVMFALCAFLNTGTLTHKLQHSDLAAGPWTDVPGGAFTTTSSPGGGQQALILDSQNIKRFVRYSFTLGGGDGIFGFVTIFQKKNG